MKDDAQVRMTKDGQTVMAVGPQEFAQYERNGWERLEPPNLDVAGSSAAKVEEALEDELNTDVVRTGNDPLTFVETDKKEDDMNNFAGAPTPTPNPNPNPPTPSPTPNPPTPPSPPSPTPRPI